MSCSVQFVLRFATSTHTNASTAAHLLARKPAHTKIRDKGIKD